MPWTESEWKAIELSARAVVNARPVARRFERAEQTDGNRDGLRYWRKIVNRHSGVVRAYAALATS